jgi:hypothetical protein
MSALLGAVFLALSSNLSSMCNKLEENIKTFTSEESHQHSAKVGIRASIVWSTSEFKSLTKQ